MENENSLMNKNVNDLTVGDALKINGVILAVMVGVPTLVYGASVAKEKMTDAFKAVRENRKQKKAEQA